MEAFRFNDDNLVIAKEHVQKYPAGKQASAVLPLLDLAQRQCGGWLPHPAIDYVANFLEMPVMRVLEIASFYSMFYLTPVGKCHLQVCGTTPCQLRGAEDIISACQKHLGIGLNETTADGLFTLSEVECLGACVNAPVVQINDDYHEEQTPETIIALLQNIKEKDDAL